MDEKKLEALVNLRWSKDKGVLFRNNTGVSWAGKAYKVSRDGSSYLKKGTMVISNPRPLRAGLCKGSSDMIGWREVEITEEMVGKKVAIFTAIELKNTDGRATKEQKNFVEAVERAGGIGRVIKEVEEIEDL